MIPRQVAIPDKSGDPSLIKHVFMIIAENRTMISVLGDVHCRARRQLVGGSAPTGYAERAQTDTRSSHSSKLLRPKPHNRRTAPVDLSKLRLMPRHQSRWVRRIQAGTAGDAIGVSEKGLTLSEAAAAGLPVKILRRIRRERTFKTAERGQHKEPTWSKLYNDSKTFEAGAEKSVTTRIRFRPNPLARRSHHLST